MTHIYKCFSFVRQTWFWQNKLLLLGGYLFCLFFALYYISGEHPMYYWDYGGYYKWVLDLCNMDLRKFVLTWGSSVRHSDYNATIAVPLMPFCYAFGPGRFPFILGVITLYLYPAILLISFLAQKYCLGGSTKNFVKVASLLIVFFSIQLWAPTMRGIPDVAVVIPLALAYCLYLSGGGLSAKREWWNTLLIGALLYATFHMRRWMAFDICAFCATAGLMSLYDLSRMQRRDMRAAIGNLFVNTGLLVLPLLVFLPALQYPLIMQILRTDYSALYIAYSTTYGENLFALYSKAGPVALILAALGIMSVLRKEQRRIALFCLLNFLIFFSLFTRTQRIELHHILGLALPFILLQVCGVYFAASFIRNAKINVCLWGGVALLAALVWTGTFVPLGKWTDVTLFPQTKVHKFYRQDWEQLLALENTMNTLLETDPDAKYYVLSGGYVLNTDILKTLGRVLSIMNVQEVKRLSDTRTINCAIVDLRDYYRILNIFSAKYIIVTDPVDTHLHREYQTAITLPAQEFLAGTGIALAYRKLPQTFSLMNDGIQCTTYLFERTRPITQTEVTAYVRRYQQRFPEYRPSPTALALCTATGHTDGTRNSIARINQEEREIRLYPGQTPSSVELHLDGLYSEFSAIAAMKSSVGDVSLRFQLDGKDMLEVRVEKGKSIPIRMDIRNVRNMRVFVEKNGDTYADVALLKDIQIMPAEETGEQK